MTVLFHNRPEESFHLLTGYASDHTLLEYEDLTNHAVLTSDLKDAIEDGTVVQYTIRQSAVHSNKLTVITTKADNKTIQVEGLEVIYDNDSYRIKSIINDSMVIENNEGRQMILSFFEIILHCDTIKELLLNK